LLSEFLVRFSVSVDSDRYYPEEEEQTEEIVIVGEDRPFDDLAFIKVKSGNVVCAKRENHHRQKKKPQDYFLIPRNILPVQKDIDEIQ